MDTLPKLLLTTVFKPFGIENKFNRKEDDLLLDLMAARLTREPGMFTLSGKFPRNALHVLAFNIKIPTKVVEYPTLEEFIKEVKKGYEYIGITFIIKEVLKVAHMITLIRKYAPKTKIIIGGFGTMIPNINHLGADYVCKGEGVKFLRQLFNEEIESEFNHPHIVAEFNLKAFNKYPFLKKHKVGLIVNGYGCPNGCDYCCTSAFYDKKHIDFLKSAKELIQTVEAFKQEDTEINNFIIWEEDLFLYKDRIEELRNLVRQDIDNSLSFACFASVSSLTDSGLSAEDLAEMGVSHIWIGVESINTDLPKRKGKDIKELFNDLHAAGITTTGSMIFGLDCQNRENLKEDVDHFISITPTTNQLSTLMAGPGTELFKKVNEENRFLKKDWRDTDLYKESVRHPNFEVGELIREVFDALGRIYNEIGPSLLRAIEVYFKGYQNFKNSDKILLRKRAEIYARRIKLLIPFFLFTKGFLPNELIKDKAKKLEKEIFNELGKSSLRSYVKGLSIYIIFLAELLIKKLRLNQEGSDEPATKITYYNYNC